MGDLDRYMVAVGAEISLRITYSYDDYDYQDYEARYRFWPWNARKLLVVL